MIKKQYVRKEVINGDTVNIHCEIATPKPNLKKTEYIIQSGFLIVDKLMFIPDFACCKVFFKSFEQFELAAYLALAVKERNSYRKRMWIATVGMILLAIPAWHNFILKIL